MSKTNKQIEAMVQGAEWGASFLSVFIRAAGQREDAMLDLHYLTTPKGAVALERLAEMTTDVRHLEFSDETMLRLKFQDDVAKALHRQEIVFDTAETKSAFRWPLERQRRRMGKTHVIGSHRLRVVTYHFSWRLDQVLNRLNIQFAEPLQFLGYLLTHREEVMGVTLATQLSDERDKGVGFCASYDSDRGQIIVSSNNDDGNLESSNRWIVQY